MNVQRIKTNSRQFKYLGLLLVSIAFFTIPSAQSQSLYSMRAGWNYCRVTGIKAETYTPQPGYHFGGGFEYIHSNPVGIKTEILFNKKGFYSITELSSAMSYQKHYNEVNQYSLFLPILTTMHFQRVSFEVGPYFDFLLNTDQYEKIVRITYPREVVAELEYFNRHKFVNPELGLVVGANMAIFKGFNFSARYMLGFTPLGRDYNWRRMSVVHLAVSKNFGREFIPRRVSKLPENELDGLNQYRIIASSHITRASFNRRGNGNQVVVRWRSGETGAQVISDINIVSSEGFVERSGNEVRINEVRFPVECRVRFKVTNTLSQQTHESYLEFEIIESGLWEIMIVNN